MKKTFFVGIFVTTILTAASYAQTTQPSQTPVRQRVIVVGASPTPAPTAVPFETETAKKVVVVTTTMPSPTPYRAPRPVPSQTPFISVGASGKLPSQPFPGNSTSINLHHRTMSFG